MSRYLFIFLAAVLISSCDKEKPLAFSSNEILSSQLQACVNKACPAIQIDYVLAQATDSRAAQINAVIEQQLGQLISSSVLPEGELFSAVQPAVDAFVLNFQDYMGDFPDSVMEYELDVETHVSYSSESLVTLATEFYIFTGGAHGYGGNQFINMDPQTGQVLDWNSLINDLEAFTSMAETAFKNQHDIPANQSVNSTGFWFENDQFSLPETYGFTQDGFEFIYNTYDISSYADGPQRVVISLSEMQPYLNPQTAL